MLRLPEPVHLRILAHALGGYPLEVCGLLVGRFDGSVDLAVGEAEVVRYEPCTNLAASARVYTLDPAEHLRIERAAEAEGLAVIGVVHSHTHTDPWPSPTDVSAAPDPSWHYVIVSLREGAPMLRSHRIDGGPWGSGGIQEEPVLVVPE